MDRDKAIRILEKYDDTYVYEDLTDKELIEKIWRVTGCSADMQGKIPWCGKISCAECWTKRLKDKVSVSRLID
ncbi:hypothetical protein PBV87_09125 [Niameybacter massiliensis]|uniref:Uncharacterized protein n=1 Tax=Holtiella tumoricola TaxID=3018743 RepID=A0AA42DMQ7_9FIRM|nr:hypothetical protein [Holtiella tumoricola]MDA3731636.1 hypothetical protein [Holtiella tumoricola]